MIRRILTMMRELVAKSRSYRRFHQNMALSRETLVELVEVARLIPTAGNKQPLKYILSYDEAKNTLVFPTLAWAAYLKNWPGPDEGERPAGYVVILGDTEISEHVLWDHAIAAQTICLAAAEMGLGTCIIGAVDRPRLKAALRIPPSYEVLLVIALGYPAETVVMDTIKDGDCKYWRDTDGIHHVPKRAMEEIILDL
jgi:nitroreductase